LLPLRFWFFYGFDGISQALCALRKRPEEISLDPLIALGGHVRANNVDVIRVRANWLFNFGS